MVNRAGLKNKLLRIVPIYGAYKVEEELREWDRSVRDEAVMHLTKSENYILSMLEKAIRKRDRDAIAQLEGARKNIHAVKERVKTATYGYFPRSSPIKIKETELKEALEIDEKIVEETETTSDKIDVLSNRFQGSEKEVLMDLEEIESDIRNIKELLLKRKTLFRKGHLEEEK